MTGLHVEKRDYSKSPWRVVITRTGLEIPDSGYPTRKAANELMKRLDATGVDWSADPIEFDETQRKHVAALLANTPMRRELVTVTQAQYKRGVYG